MLRLRTAAMGAAVVLGIAGVAGAQAETRPDSAGRGMRDGMGRHGQMGPGRGGKGRGQRGEHGKFMSDLKLSDAQKNQLKTIHAKYEPQMKTLREQMKGQFGPARDARQKGDTSAATRARFQKQREDFRSRSMAIRQQEMNEVRGILTGDQRTKWDAAQAQRKQRMEARQKGMQNRRGQVGKGRKA